MQRLQWEVTRFSAGMHTDPSRVEGGTQFARNVQNLRANRNGHLVPRFNFATVETRWDSAKITGIAAATDYLVYLLDNGQLWIRFADEPDRDRLVNTTEQLQGKLSLISEYADFAIVKAETGPGLWLDLRRDVIARNRQVDAYPLGLDVPNWRANATYIPGTPGGIFEVGSAYVFRWTNARVFANSQDAFIENRLSVNAPPFAGMESNPGTPQIFAFLGPDDANANLRTFRDADGNELLVNVIRSPYATVNLTGIAHADDRQVTGVFLYQSQAVPALQQTLPDGTRVGDLFIDDLVYRRIDYLPRGRTSTRLGPRGSAEHWPEQVQLQFDNDKLPEDVKTIALYRDRIFAPTPEGLRYSDMRFGTPTHWAFPKVNTIRRPAVTGIEHRGVFLFGGPGGLFRLTGESEFNFDVDRVGHAGPVSSHAMGALADTIGFAGRAGFYVTDGATVQKVSDAIERDFEGAQALSGLCEVLPDQGILFAAELQDRTGTAQQLFYHFENGAWFRVDGQQIHQLALAEQNRARLFAATGKENLKELIWEHSHDIADGDEPIEWLWESQDLDWNSERFKHFRWLEIAGIANSVILASQQRFDLANATRTLKGWRFGNKIITAGNHVWVEDTGPARVLVSIFSDDRLALQKVMELTRDELRPLRVPINRRGIACRIRIQGSGAVILRGLKLDAAV